MAGTREIATLDQEVSSRCRRAPRKAERLPWLRKLATAPLARHHVTSVYFDTGTNKLRRHGVSLRVRRLGARQLQTIKGANGGLARFERVGAPETQIRHGDSVGYVTPAPETEPVPVKEPG